MPIKISGAGKLDDHRRSCRFFPVFPGVKELVELYQELDLEADRFKKAVGLDCLKGCKKCCTPGRAQIEASVFECLPLAIHLWNVGEAELFLQRILASEGKNLCELYNPDDSALPALGCRHYGWRPLLCRLFGFSAVLDKRGHPRIALCRAIKEAGPQAEDRINREIARGLKTMIIPHWGQKASSLNPHLGQKRYPINQAIRIATEKVGFQLHLLEAREDQNSAVGQEDFKENRADNRSY